MLGSLFANDAALSTKTYEFGDAASGRAYAVRVRCVPAENQHVERWVPHVVWSAATETCAELASPRHAPRDAFAFVRGASVLELGSGTGLCGMLCAELSGLERGCVLTDGSAGAVAELERAVALNPECVRLGVAATQLRWGDDAQLAELLAQRGGRLFEVVVGTDVVYEAQFVAPLLATAAAALREGGHLVLANHKFRFRAFNETVRASLAGFPLSLERHVLLSDQVDLLVFRRG